MGYHADVGESASACFIEQLDYNSTVEITELHCINGMLFDRYYEVKCQSHCALSWSGWAGRNNILSRMLFSPGMLLWFLLLHLYKLSWLPWCNVLWRFRFETQKAWVSEAGFRISRTTFMNNMTQKTCKVRNYAKVILKQIFWKLCFIAQLVLILAL